VRISIHRTTAIISSPMAMHIAIIHPSGLAEADDNALAPADADGAHAEADDNALASADADGAHAEADEDARASADADGTGVGVTTSGEVTLKVVVAMSLPLPAITVSLPATMSEGTTNEAEYLPLVSVFTASIYTILPTSSLILITMFSSEPAVPDIKTVSPGRADVLSRITLAAANTVGMAIMYIRMKVHNPMVFFITRPYSEHKFYIFR